MLYFQFGKVLVTFGKDNISEQSNFKQIPTEKLKWCHTEETISLSNIQGIKKIKF